MFSKKLSSVLIFFILTILTTSTYACETCTIPNLGKYGPSVTSQDQRWFFKYILEGQVWHEKEAGEAHELHHQGHHFHDKTKEYMHHMSLGNHLMDELTLLIEVPYVIRHSIEIDDHSILGSKQKSEGIGDLHLIGLYKFWKEGESSADWVGGVKFPTGDTKEENTIGTRFEAELQPGSGSYDYIMGGISKTKINESALTANLVYVLKTQGAQDYEFGDLLSASALWEFLNFNKWNSDIKIGLDTSLQYEQKHKDHGAKTKDSGGVTLLMGPSVTAQVSPNVALLCSFHLPAYQNLGGVHQELDFSWTAGGKLS